MDVDHKINDIVEKAVNNVLNDNVLKSTKLAVMTLTENNNSFLNKLATDAYNAGFAVGSDWYRSSIDDVVVILKRLALYEDNILCEIFEMPCNEFCSVNDSCAACILAEYKLSDIKEKLDKYDSLTSEESVRVIDEIVDNLKDSENIDKIKEVLYKNLPKDVLEQRKE